jgi:hypothetical protein
MSFAVQIPSQKYTIIDTVIGFLASINFDAIRRHVAPKSCNLSLVISFSARYLSMIFTAR